MCEVDPHTFYSWGDDYCFGRCESYLVESWSAKLAYAYIVVHDLSQFVDVKGRRDTSHDLENFKNMVYEVAKDYFIEPKDEFEAHNSFTESNFMSLLNRFDGLIKDYNAYVDHVEDFDGNGFYDKLVTDKEFIRRLVFNPDSYITVGGDEYRGFNIKTVGFQYDYPDKYNLNVTRNENYWEHYHDPREWRIGEFWDKVKEYSKDFEVFFKGN